MSNRRMLHTHPLKQCHGSVANSGMWVDVTGVLSRCRFRSLISAWPWYSWAIAGGLSPSKMAAQPSGGGGGKGQKSYRGFSTHSTGNSGGRSRRHVDWCCSFTRHSTFLTLGPSSRTCECHNTRHHCTDCVCWRQCKNHGAFLPRTPGEGLLGRFCMAVYSPPANPLHRWDPQAGHGTKGRQSERGEGGGGGYQAGDK